MRMLVRGLWLESLGALIFGVCLPFCALVVGRDVGDLVTTLLLQRRHASLNGCMPEKPTDEGSGEMLVSDNQSSEHALSPKKLLALGLLLVSFLVLFSLSIVGAVLDRESRTRRSFWASTMLAPVGAVLRWKLSPLNRRRPTFPIGTFAANMTAVLLDVAIGAALLIQSDSSTDEKLFLSAVITGLGGSLSTVSTWIAEAYEMTRPQKYTYILGSVVCAQLLGILVYGSTFWSTK